jgi:hypothetical protein
MGLFSNLSFRKRGQPEAAIEAAPAAEMESAEAAVAPALEPAPAPEPPVAPALSASVRAQAEELVQRVVQELPAFISVAVVEAATGRILAGRWAGHSGGAVEVAAANAEVVRQTRQCLAALQLADTEQVADVLITLRQQLHLLRVLPQADWLLCLAMPTQDTNPALVRAVMQSIE